LQKFSPYPSLLLNVKSGFIEPCSVIRFKLLQGRLVVNIPLDLALLGLAVTINVPMLLWTDWVMVVVKAYGIRLDPRIALMTLMPKFPD